MLTILIVVALLFFFWPQICAFLSNRFLPWVEETFGETIGGMMKTLTVWLDRSIRGVRRGLKTAWRFFKERVLRIRTVYSTVNGSDAKAETISVVDVGNGRVAEIIETRTLSMDDIPLQMQEEIIRQNKDSSGVRKSEVDEKEVIHEQAKKRLEEDKKMAASQEEEDELQKLCDLVNA